MNKNNSSIQTIALNFIEKKDNKTFSILINRLKPGIFSFAYRYVKDKDLANEIVSQVFETIWIKIDQYNPNWSFSTWAYAIAKNQALGMIRNNNKTLSFDKYTNTHSKLLQMYNPVFVMNTEVMGPTGEELTQQLFDASLAAINELDEPYKTVMIEREIKEKQLNEIATYLNWNLSTVKTRLRKARKDVAEVLYKKYPDAVDAYFGNADE